MSEKDLREKCDHDTDWEDWGDAFVCEGCKAVFEKPGCSQCGADKVEYEDCALIDCRMRHGPPLSALETHNG